MLYHSTKLQVLIDLIGKLPGLGPRSARRIAINLLNKPELIRSLANSLGDVVSNLNKCSTCGNIDLSLECSICSNSAREKQIICVVESINEMWAMERSASFNGQYHIVGGVISALNGTTPEKLNIHNILDRIILHQVKEIILAISATLDGQTTAYYISDLVSEHCPNVKISRLAYGIPVGGEIEYMDEGTIKIALRLRQDF